MVDLAAPNEATFVPRRRRARMLPFPFSPTAARRP